MSALPDVHECMVVDNDRYELFSGLTGILKIMEILLEDKNADINHLKVINKSNATVCNEKLGPYVSAVVSTCRADIYDRDNAVFFMMVDNKENFLDMRALIYKTDLFKKMLHCFTINCELDGVAFDESFFSIAEVVDMVLAKKGFDMIHVELNAEGNDFQIYDLFGSTKNDD